MLVTNRHKRNMQEDLSSSLGGRGLESDDTYKPLLNQLGDNPAIVKSYIMTIDTSEAENIKAIIKDIAALLPEATVQMFVWLVWIIW